MVLMHPRRKDVFFVSLENLLYQIVLIFLVDQSLYALMEMHQTLKDGRQNVD